MELGELFNIFNNEVDETGRSVITCSLHRYDKNKIKEELLLEQVYYFFVTAMTLSVDRKYSVIVDLKNIKQKDVDLIFLGKLLRIFRKEIFVDALYQCIIKNPPKFYKHCWEIVLGWKIIDPPTLQKIQVTAE